jgi:CRP-like cAMP-binding protein
MFSPLGPEVIERLAANLETVVVTRGSTIIRQGDVGERFFILDEGRAEASVDGRMVATFDPGDYFGEIALLRDVPRTASVVARSDARLYALAREEFLLAVTGEPESVAAAKAVVDVRSPGPAPSERSGAP